MKLNDQRPCLCYCCGLLCFDSSDLCCKTLSNRDKGTEVLRCLNWKVKLCWKSVCQPPHQYELVMETRKHILNSQEESKNQIIQVCISIPNASCTMQAAASLWHGHFGPRKSQFLLWAVHHLALRSGVNSTLLQCCILIKIDEDEWTGNMRYFHATWGLQALGLMAILEDLRWKKSHLDTCLQKQHPIHCKCRTPADPLVFGRIDTELWQNENDMMLRCSNASGARKYKAAWRVCANIRAAAASSAMLCNASKVSNQNFSSLRSATFKKYRKQKQTFKCWNHLIKLNIVTLMILIFLSLNLWSIEPRILLAHLGRHLRNLCGSTNDGTFGAPQSVTSPTAFSCSLETPKPCVHLPRANA